jgi:hypothetical protein
MVKVCLKIYICPIIRYGGSINNSHKLCLLMCYSLRPTVWMLIQIMLGTSWTLVLARRVHCPAHTPPKEKRKEKKCRKERAAASACNALPSAQCCLPHPPARGRERPKPNPNPLWDHFFFLRKKKKNPEPLPKKKPHCSSLPPPFPIWSPPPILVKSAGFRPQWRSILSRWQRISFACLFGLLLDSS